MTHYDYFRLAYALKLQTNFNYCFKSVAKGKLPQGYKINDYSFGEIKSIAIEKFFSSEE